MNEGYGDTVFDVSGNGHHGNIYGAMWTVNTFFGETLSLEPTKNNEFVTENDHIRLFQGL